MSKIVVHLILLYSIVRHKVWFLFRIKKGNWKWEFFSFYCDHAHPLSPEYLGGCCSVALFLPLSRILLGSTFPFPTAGIPQA